MKLANLATHLAISNDTKHMEQDLRRLLERLSAAFAAKGYDVRPYHEKNWITFGAFPAEKKKEIYFNVCTYSEIYLPVLALPGSPNEDGRLLWAAMKRHGLRPCGDFFNQVEEDDIVEFYNVTGRQMFHNINFFDVCSYTFLEIFSYPFTELWVRDESAAAGMQQVMTDFMGGKIRSTIDSPLSKQYLLEAFSEENYIIELEFRKFSPMYSSDGAFAVIACVSKGALLEESAYRQILANKPHLPRPQRPLVLV
jgi:hypothetical protein